MGCNISEAFIMFMKLLQDVKLLRLGTGGSVGISQGASVPGFQN